MTKQEAINELTRAADLCPTTPLAEACRMAVAMMGTSEKRYCGTCIHAAKTMADEPCKHCNFRDKWEPKEVDNGKTD